MARILLIDDDSKLRAMVTEYLRTNGYAVIDAADAERGLLELKRGELQNEIELVLLDVMMSGIDGLEALRRIRLLYPTLPVIMLTAKGDETDRIVGLELGADDYLAKPFGPRELLARIRALLRRTSPSSAGSIVRVGALSIDESARQASVGDRALDLTGLEFDLLSALAKRAGRVLSREKLLEAIGRSDIHVNDRAIDVHISHLRQKLLSRATSATQTTRVSKDSAAIRESVTIKTVRGVGYIFSSDSLSATRTDGGTDS